MSINSNIYAGIIVEYITLTDNANVDISSVVRQSFVVGRWYSLKEIKAMIQSVYDVHTPGKTAKATDIEKYFQCTPKKYAVGPGKRENGYMITG